MSIYHEQIAAAGAWMAKFRWWLGVLGAIIALPILLRMMSAYACPSFIDKPNRLCTDGQLLSGAGACVDARAVMAAEAAATAVQCSNFIMVFGLMLSLVTTVGLWFTIQLNRSALAVAREANEKAQEQSETQVRAYVLAQDIQCNITETGQISVKAAFFNAGSTPAYNLKWSFRAVIERALIEHEGEPLVTLAAREKDWESLPESHDVEPNEKRESLTLKTSFPNYTRAAGADELVYVSITVSYADAMKLKRKETSSFGGWVKVTRETQQHKMTLKRLDNDFVAMKLHPDEIVTD